MKFVDLITGAAGDSLILNSTADYFQSLSEKGIEMVDKLSFVISNHDDPNYVRPEFDYSIVYESDQYPVNVDVDQFLDALESDADEFTDATTGVVIKVDDLVDQLSNSLSVNRVIVQSLKTLAQSATESIASITTSFYTNLQLTLGTITETASNLASDLLNIMTQAGKSVGDKVRDILDYMGLYNIGESDVEEIGLPETRINEVSGSNVWASWFAAVPKRLKDFGPWIKDLVNNILELIKSVVSIALGSSTYRALQKFFLTITMQADSFSINAGDSENMSVGNMGFSWTQSVGNMPEIIPNTGYRSTKTMVDCLKILTAWFNPVEPYTPTVACPPIYNALVNAVSSVAIAMYNPSVPAEIVLKYIRKGYIPRLPSWISSAGINVREINDFSSWTVYQYAVYLYANIYGRYYLKLSNTPLSIFEMIQAVVGVWLDYNHLNDETGVVNHLSTTSYVQLDLPGSTLYVWLAGNKIVCTRRVTPLSYFKDWTAGSILQYFGDMIQSNPVVGSNDRYFITLGNPGIIDDVDCINIVDNTYGAFLSTCRSFCGQNITTDAEMMKSCFAANIADAVFLMAVDAMDANNIPFDYNFTDVGLVQLRGSYQNRRHYSDFFFFTYALTGRSWPELADLARLDSTSITNKDLAKMIGADLGYFDMDDESKIDYIHISESTSPILKLLSETSNPNVYIPFCHADHIASGQYGVLLDSEMVNIVSTFLKVVAVIAATLYIMKKVKSLKKQAMALSTKADATAWSMIEQGTYDQHAIDTQYKMQRRASLCEKISQGIFGAVGKVVSTVGSTITSSVSAFTSKIKTLVSGSRGSSSLSSVQDKISEENAALDGRVTDVHNKVRDVETSVDELEGEVIRLKKLISGSV